MRAILSHSSSAAHNETFEIVYSVLYGAGFYWVLYSAYCIVLDRLVSATSGLSTSAHIHL
jgi:hypothetical protein